MSTLTVIAMILGVLAVVLMLAFAAFLFFVDLWDQAFNVDEYLGDPDETE